MRILWLKTELLHPIDKGGKIRTYHMLRELKREHHVTYLSLDDRSAASDAESRATEYCQELIRVPHQTRPKFSPGFYAELATNLLSPLPYFMKKYESKGMRREIEKLTGRDRFDVLVCDFLQPSVNVPLKIVEPTVLFQHNVEAMIWKRHYEVQSNPIKRAYLYGQWRKSFNYERAACQRFDRVIAVSREDAETMQRDYGVDGIADVPTGVDTEFFKPSGNVERDPVNLVFTGSMDWLPNEDAIQWFTKEIFPLVKRMIPNATLTVVGRDPYPSLIDLAKIDSSIIVTGRVDDVRPYIERAAAYVVPIRVGGGTRLKIYEAMAMAKPIVSTTVGAEGLPVRDQEELLIADTPEAFANSIISVLREESLGARLGANATKLVIQNFGWDRVANAFAQICQSALRGDKSFSGSLVIEPTTASVN